MTSSGDLFGWGWNDIGQLGLGYESDYEYTPKPVNRTGEFVGKSVCELQGGVRASFAKTCDGQVYGWGHWYPLGTPGGTQSNPQRIAIPAVVDQVALGYLSAIALSTSGDIYVWGMYAATSGIRQLVGIELGALQGKRAKQVACYSHYYVITDDGQLFVWGTGGSIGFRADGSASTNEINSPVAVPLTGALLGARVRKIFTAGINYAVLFENTVAGSARTAFASAPETETPLPIAPMNSATPIASASTPETVGARPPARGTLQGAPPDSAAGPISLSPQAGLSFAPKIAAAASAFGPPDRARLCTALAGMLLCNILTAFL